MRTDKKKPKKHIAPFSAKKLDELAKYRLVRDKYLESHPKCEVHDCNSEQIELHHKNKRNGDRVHDDTYFMSVCRMHHTWIHEHPKESRELGYLI